MRFVVDASVAIRWPTVEEDADVAKELATSGWDIHAPRQTVSELANALWRKAQAGEIERRVTGVLLASVPDIHVRRGAHDLVSPKAIHLGQVLDHTVYDCMYLAFEFGDEIFSGGYKPMHRSKAAIDRNLLRAHNSLRIPADRRSPAPSFPIPSCSVLDLRIVERPTVGLETSCGALLRESFQNVHRSNSIRLNARKKNIKIVGILASIALTWNLLEQGTVLRCHQIDQPIGVEFLPPVNSRTRT